MIFSISSKSFGDKRVLGQINLQMERGSITAIMGPSGSGKTSLLRIIAGLDLDDNKSQQPKRKIGMMLQEPYLLPWKTVIENIEIAGSENGLLAMLGLTDAAKLYPRQLSLGMARRVAFARALASKPDLLVFDEPFASLDDALVDTLRLKMIEISNASDTPILLTTHNLQDAVTLKARLFMLEGEPAQLRRMTSYDRK